MLVGINLKILHSKQIFFCFNILKLSIFEDSDLSLQSLSCQNPKPQSFLPWGNSLEG